jgi:hypothetical protein
MRISVLGALACALALATLSCNELNPPKSRPRAIVWKAIGSWSGHGSSQTDSFDVSVFRWRIHWKTENDTAPGKSHFAVTAMSGVSGRPIADAISHDGPGEGYAEINDDPRLYYLVVDSNDLNWTVTAEEPIATGGSPQ